MRIHYLREQTADIYYSPKERDVIESQYGDFLGFATVLNREKIKKDLDIQYLFSDTTNAKEAINALRDYLSVNSPDEIILDSGDHAVYTLQQDGITLEINGNEQRCDWNSFTSLFLLSSQMEHMRALDSGRKSAPIERKSAPIKNTAEPTPNEEMSAQEQNLWPVGNTIPNEIAEGQNNVPADTKFSAEIPEDTARERAERRMERKNFVITDENLGVGAPKEKYTHNIEAIRLLKELEKNQDLATPEQQEVLSKYVGWGGLSKVFDETVTSGWELQARTDLQEILTVEEYKAARASTLNAHYTSPEVIKAMYQGLEQLGFKGGNILEPSIGVGNFFGLLPEQMKGSRLFGVELDMISGAIAKQLYQNASISVCGYESCNYPDSLFDVAVGNVPFGGYKVNDKEYNKNNLLIHDYFFAKTLDKVRPGGVVAFITSKGTLDKANPAVRKYLAQRAELIGAIRLPNNAFLANAGTEVTSDIIFLQKRERPKDITPDWVYTGHDSHDIQMNRYFIDNPHMILGTMTVGKSMYGNENETTCEAFQDTDLGSLLADAMQNIRGNIPQLLLTEETAQENPDTLPADPTVKNYSYTVVGGNVYFRENSIMTRPEISADTINRIKGLVEMSEAMRGVIDLQLEEEFDELAFEDAQLELNRRYDNFVIQHGRINDRKNANAFQGDSSYHVLSALEKLDENRSFVAKTDMFSKRTIRPKILPEHVDTPVEALMLSVSEKTGVDLQYMSALTGMTEEHLIDALDGVIFKNPALSTELTPVYETADEYLSGNVRQKLEHATIAERAFPGEYSNNIAALTAALPRDLPAGDIDVRLGATWIDAKFITQFIEETMSPAYYAHIEAEYTPFDSSWRVKNKNGDSRTNTRATVTYGTTEANAYRIIEDTLNLRDVRIYKTVKDQETGKERRVINSQETALAQQKQEAIKELFKEWIFKDPERRETLTKKYNELFNSTRPRSYDGSCINFFGMNPEISLGQHQKDAVARIIFGGNTLLAHEVGAGKTFEMAAGIMESKRLGLCKKALWVVPNHLTDQTASEFLNLYPGANILVATKKDFETQNRKRFCAQIATGDYDAVIMGFSQFEKIPVSTERQTRLINEQIDELTDVISELKGQSDERLTVKQMEKTKKSLEARLKKLSDQSRKDDVINFEELGIDRLVVDEAHNYKNLFFHTKMRNVAGLAQTEAQKSTDLFLKCRYMDEITDGKGIIFATGTPISNSMTEMYTMMSYLQADRLKKMKLNHFDAWASTFGETVNAVELAPEGTGYRTKTRFAKFYNLPELMSVFKDAADIKTADMLNLPRPEAEYHTISVEPSEFQRQLMASLSERAAAVHNKTVAPEDDNMLKITTDGRKIGLDQRLYDDKLPDLPGTKVNVCIDNVYRIWEENKDQKSTQLIFCDFSTPSKEKFNLYDDIKAKLLAKGIPEDEIAFIHSADTEQKKKELFAKVRSGKVRILMGSTAKMGAGTNVQDKLIAIHDLDCPWRPSDLEQRAGRIVRQGNENAKVDIYRYVTKDTFDAYLYQTIENKQKFISQVMTSKSAVRSCEDVDESVLQYSEIKALCAGDPRIKEKMELDVKVAKLRMAKNSYTNNRHQLEDNLLKRLPAAMSECRSNIKALENDFECYKKHSKNLQQSDTAQSKDLSNLSEGELRALEVKELEATFPGMTIFDRICTKKESAGKALLEVKEQVTPREMLRFGSYCGFDMYMGYSPLNKYYFIEMQNENGYKHSTALGTDVYGNLTCINNCLNKIESTLTTEKLKLEHYQEEMKGCEDDLKKPFAQEQEFKDLSARLAELDIALSLDTPHPAESDPAEVQVEQENEEQTQVAEEQELAVGALDAAKTWHRPQAVKEADWSR